MPMEHKTTGAQIGRVIQLLARLPGFGPRSARRAALHLMKNRQSLLDPLARALQAAAETVRTCPECGNLDTEVPCAICASPKRRRDIICVVEDISDLWALERAGAFHGLYHVTGGVLSPIDGVTPEDLNIPALVARAAQPEVKEIILALNATVEGQTTGHYITQALRDCDVTITRLAHGVPVGGELDYLDEGTLAAALKARR